MLICVNGAKPNHLFFRGAILKVKLESWFFIVSSASPCDYDCPESFDATGYYWEIAEITARGRHGRKRKQGSGK